MTEVNTYSSAVDMVVVRSGRPDRRADIMAYVRQAVRECQVIAFFAHDLVEDTLTSTGDPYLWDLPQEFRTMRTVRYNIFNRRNELIYPPNVRPGKKQREEDYYYYRGIDYLAFAGVAADVLIDVAYYSYTKKIPYYQVADRPATFSLEDDAWSYLTATTAAEEETARNLVSNWLLFDWYDLIVEGGLAKIFKTVGDQRSTSSFALYKSLQKDLRLGEDNESLEM